MINTLDHWVRDASGVPVEAADPEDYAPGTFTKSNSEARLVFTVAGSLRLHIGVWMLDASPNISGLHPTFVLTTIGNGVEEVIYKAPPIWNDSLDGEGTLDVRVRNYLYFLEVQMGKAVRDYMETTGSTDTGGDLPFSNAEWRAVWDTLAANVRMEGADLKLREAS